MYLKSHPVRSLFDFSLVDLQPTTTSTQRHSKNGLAPPTFEFVCWEPRICWDIWWVWRDRIQRWHVVTSTPSRIFQLVVAVCVTVTPTLVLWRTHEVKLDCSPVHVSTTPAAFNASNAALDLSRKSGDKTPTRGHSSVNVKKISFSKESLIENLFFQLATVMDILIVACTLRKLTWEANRWTFMVVMRAEVFARTVDTTPKESTVINAKTDTIDLMEKLGTKLTFVNVSFKLMW